MALVDRIIETGLTPATVILAGLMLIVISQLRWRGPFRIESSTKILASLSDVWRYLDHDDPENNVLAIGLQRQKLDSDLPTYVTGKACPSSTSGFPADIFSTMIVTERVVGSHMVSITQFGTAEKPTNRYMSRDGSELMYIKTVEEADGVSASLVSMVQSPQLWLVAMITLMNPQRLVLRRLKDRAEYRTEETKVGKVMNVLVKDVNEQIARGSLK